ncbi:MAG TPA: replication-associated recombination protein A [Phycisphaerae bacterium]|nr:replication-associated recombination protein A [Phycisphaerae bacterium]
MDLFSEQRAQHLQAVEPLAVRMRPRTLDEFRGQDHFLGEGKLLRRMLLADRLTSAVFYGPPGCGKTTLAHVIAEHTHAAFVEVNAAAVGVREVRAILADARARIESGGGRTVLFIDELHRFNRAQQDVLLGDVERGIVILLGATTENPFFAINTPLLSRSQIFRFEALTEDDLVALMYAALEDSQRGFGAHAIELAPDAARHLAVCSDGDARRALTALEVAVRSQLEASGGSVGPIRIDAEVAADSIQRKVLRYDADGDEHYDHASALIKSIRGSDPDAAVYWLARMLEAGEDPRFIARRVVIAAAEDIGNADPWGLIVAQAAADATAFIGLPECQLPLSQAVIYLACAPKSNAAALAVWSAGDDVRNARTVPVPAHLRDTHYAGSKKLGAGEGYVYPHDQPDGLAAQQYLTVDKRYYEPTDRGYEVRIAERLAAARARREQKNEAQE